MTYRLIITNCIKDMLKLEPFVEEVSERFGVAPDVVFQLHLALDEALANSVNYAYPQGTDGTIMLEAQKEGRVATFRLIDKGMAFDPTTLGEDIDITSGVEERRIGGLGVFLIKQMMDSVSYERLDGQNILIMKKKI